VASFPYLTELVSYTFVSVNQRNNEVQAYMYVPFTNTNVIWTGSVKIGKTRRTKYPQIYGYFYSVGLVTAVKI